MNRIYLEHKLNERLGGIEGETYGAHIHVSRGIRRDSHIWGGDDGSERISIHAPVRSNDSLKTSAAVELLLENLHSATQ